MLKEKRGLKKDQLDTASDDIEKER